MSRSRCHYFTWPESCWTHRADGAKAHQRANIILRSFLSIDVGSLVRAFVVCIRPMVEYNSVICSPSTVRDIELIERVQRRFTKRLPGFKTYCYDDRLSTLCLPSLELRRLHIDLIMCYKIVFGIVDVKFGRLLQTQFCCCNTWSCL